MEHGAEAKKMYVWVRRDASMLQVREAISIALKVKLSQAGSNGLRHLKIFAMRIASRCRRVHECKLKSLEMLEVYHWYIYISST